MMYFVGSRNQRGHGLGGLFRSVLRVAVPFIKRAAVPLLKRTAKTALKAAGRQALTSGAAIAEDLMAGRSFKTAVRARAKEGLKGVMKTTQKAVMGAAGFPPGSNGAKRKRPNNKGVKKGKAKRTKLQRRDIFS